MDIRVGSSADQQAADVARDAQMATSLRRRRERLEGWRDRATGVNELIIEVDAALERLEHGHHRSCVVCHGSIEPDRLASDPLVRVCLDCLSDGERRLLEYDLELAAEVQQTLTSSDVSTLSGWDLATLRRPHGPVSGDWCDLLPYLGGALAVIGDVSGKGVSAALLAAQIQALFRAEADHGRDLGEMVERINRLFCYASPDRAFATLVAAHITSGGTVSMVVAGHCLPLLRKPDGVVPVGPGGPPIGIVCQARYSAIDLSLSRGDALLMVTDGILESTAPDGSELGTERLARAFASNAGIPASDIAVACLEAAARHRAGGPSTDDITVFVARMLSG